MKINLKYNGEEKTAEELQEIYLASVPDMIVVSEAYQQWLADIIDNGELLISCSEYTFDKWYKQQKKNKSKNIQQRAQSRVDQKLDLPKKPKQTRKKIRKTSDFRRQVQEEIIAMYQEIDDELRQKWERNSENIKAKKKKEAIHDGLYTKTSLLEKHNKTVVEELNFVEWLGDNLESFTAEQQEAFDEILKTSDCLDYIVQGETGSWHWDGYRRESLASNNVEEFLEATYTGNCGSGFIHLMGYESESDIANIFVDRFCEAMSLSENVETVSRCLWELYDDDIVERSDELIYNINVECGHVLKCLSQNEAYKNILEEAKELERLRQLEEQERERRRQEEAREREILRTKILTNIPEQYADLYPLTRQMKRRFVLHVGPTNSGKTYAAMQALRNAGNGIYLAPLRLLAFEQYEQLNADGYPCSLVTGEEREIVEGATIQASTVEMMDRTMEYKVAVIDEAQMVADRDRGWAWTAAILGLRSPKIHICLAPNARKRIVALIEECGDEYEIIQHNRQTSLVFDKKKFKFPESVEKHDALIVFSKRNVHAVAHELREKGISCSIIYGNLPYDVRQAEARKFADGETDVLVSTDAIGMGLNLPIKRVVFLETGKFDGKQRRQLLPWEAQQIAGRAGRKGIYERGLYTAEDDASNIEALVNKEPHEADKATIGFPESFIGLEGKISEIIKRWNELPAKDGYARMDTATLQHLAEELEALTDDKQLIYKFATLPFRAEGVEKHIWRVMVSRELKGERLTLEETRGIHPLISDHMKLDELEQAHKICDLLYCYCTNFDHPEDVDEILQLKKDISKKILEVLENSKLHPRRCKYCGQKLKWNYPYGMCQKCHDEQYGYHYWEDYW